MAVDVRPKPWTTTGAERREFVRSMFGRIAPTYDLLNSLMTFGAHRRWRRLAVSVLELKPGEPALDVCCGTGDFAFELRTAGAGRVVAVDFSEPMLAAAARKAEGGNRKSEVGNGAPSPESRHATPHRAEPISDLRFPTSCITWLLADALRIPLADASVGAVTVGWGLRNLPDVESGLREICRVLRPGGMFVSLDMSKPGGPLVWPASLYCRHVVPLLGALLGNREAYTYLPNSVDSFPARKALAEMAKRVGFSNVTTRAFAFGAVCIHMGAKL